MTQRYIPNLAGGLTQGMRDWLLELRDNVAATGLIAHYDSGMPQITTPDASDLATSKTLTQAITNAFVAHGADVGAHSVADAALDVPAAYTSHPAVPADLAEVQAALNELKTDLNTHLANATPHRGGGQGGYAVVAVSTTNAIDQATSNALANALKAAFNLHLLSGMKEPVIE